MKTWLNVLGAALCAGSLCVPANAAERGYPTRPIRLIVPYAPGGNVDITARIVAPPLGDVLGQNVVVDNRPGGGGIVGANMVAKATPDGYTLLMGSSGSLSVNPVVHPDIPYDSVKDFAPISRVHAVPLVILANKNVPVHTVRDFIALAKSRPGKVTVASAGSGTTNHFAIALFASMTGTQLLHVPYKGSGPALSELLGGQVQTMFDQLTSSIGYIRDGRVNVLAVTSRKRSVALPAVPTLEESGLHGYEASTYVGVLAPGGTPRAIVNKLNAGMLKVMQMPSVLERLRALGTDAGGSTPEQFRNLIRDELQKWRNVAKASHLKFN